MNILVNESNFDAVLLAAGFGTRLLPLTKSWPKCLMPIRGRPILNYWIIDVIKENPSRIFLNTHYRSEDVVKFVCDKGLEPKVQLLHETSLLGTAGTIGRLPKGSQRLPILVVHTDNWSDLSLNKLLEAHIKMRPSYCPITMGLFRTSNPESCGIVSVNENNIVYEFEEKPMAPKSNLANAAVYVFEPEVVDFIQHNGLSDISSQVLPHYVDRIFTYMHNGIHRDIGTVAELVNAQSDKIKADLIESNDDWDVFFSKHEIISKVERIVCDPTTLVNLK